MGLQALLNHAEPIAKPLCNLCVFLALCNHCLGVLTSSRVCCCNLCKALLGSRPRTCPTMQSAAAISLVCWALARGAPACFGATSLPWPVRPEPPFNADGDVIFRYHSGNPISGVLFYRKFCRATRGVPVSARTTFVGCGGRICSGPYNWNSNIKSLKGKDQTQPLCRFIAFRFWSLFPNRNNAACPFEYENGRYRLAGNVYRLHICQQSRQILHRTSAQFHVPWVQRP